MNKESKYINKNCDWCFEEEIKPCDFHQQYSLARCLKEIKQEKQDRWRGRIGLSAFIAFLILWLIFGIVIADSAIIAQSVVNLPIVVGLLLKAERSFNKGIKKYEKEKKEGAEIN